MLCCVVLLRGGVPLGNENSLNDLPMGLLKYAATNSVENLLKGVFEGFSKGLFAGLLKDLFEDRFAQRLVEDRFAQTCF